MKLNLLVILGIASSLAAAMPAKSSKCVCDTKVVDNLLFSDNLSEFGKARDNEDPQCCDWSSDGCSKSPDNPFGFDFVPSCHRHDFGYRNAKDQDRFDKELREKIDDNFKDDLYSVCDEFDGLLSFRGVQCRRVADIYHGIVRKCGDGECFEEE